MSADIVALSGRAAARGRKRTVCGCLADHGPERVRRAEARRRGTFRLLLRGTSARAIVRYTEYPPIRRIHTRSTDGMLRSSRWTQSASALGLALLAACGTSPGPTPTPSPAPAMQDHAHMHGTASTATTAADGDSAGVNRGDVAFMQGMIGHHAQALVMTAMVPQRTTRPDVRLIAERIDASQHEEIARMQRWLRARGQTAPDPSAHTGHDMPGHAMMPGMLTAEELARLGAATGPEFDRMFLEYMIRHHQGALTMVSQLFGTQGAAQDSELYQFASDVDADQRMEIDRMRQLQSGPAAGPRQR